MPGRHSPPPGRFFSMGRDLPLAMLLGFYQVMSLFSVNFSVGIFSLRNSINFSRAIFIGVVRVSFRFSAQVLVFKEGRGP